MEILLFSLTSNDQVATEIYIFNLHDFIREQRYVTVVAYSPRRRHVLNASRTNVAFAYLLRTWPVLPHRGSTRKYHSLPATGSFYTDCFVHDGNKQYKDGGREREGVNGVYRGCTTRVAKVSTNSRETEETVTSVAISSTGLTYREKQHRFESRFLGNISDDARRAREVETLRIEKGSLCVSCFRSTVKWFW